MKTLASITAMPRDLRNSVERPTYTSNRFNYFAGIIIMALNKVRHDILGYTSSRGFKFEDIDRVVQYDLRVVRRWMDYLESYEKGASNFFKKNILELGPGSDLGVGLIALAEGAKSYNALDVHNLIMDTPKAFYDALLEHLQQDPYLKTDVAYLRRELEKFMDGEKDRLNYVANKNFDLSTFGDKSIDLIVSNSAFQQFDNPEKTIKELSDLACPGAYFVALIDLKTHTRWINKRDPLNIYRYPEIIYKTLKFKGSQNRVRPNEFKKMLEANNWENVQVVLRHQLDTSYLNAVQPTLRPRFRTQDAQMEALTCIICAKKI
jgi:SAM-dependent methyltransferase